MSGQSPYLPATPYGYSTNFQQRDTRYPGNSSVDTAMVLNRRPSLLASYHNHFTSPERNSLAPYIYSLAAPVSMGPHVEDHTKRPRYPTSIPLSIDIKKEQPLYQPQTEAISPILDEPKLDSSLRDTTIIRNSISKLESDIETTMKKLHRAKFNQNEIKNQADRSAADEEENDEQNDFFQPNDSQTLIEKILHDNKKKAEDSQKLLNQLNNNMDLTIPLYQEANDLESIVQIRTQYMNVMKNRLINLFQKSRERYMSRTKFESEKYDQVYDQWQKSIEKDEKAILAKDISTYRETFEKTFSELRKVREDKEKKQSIPTTTDPSLSSTDPPPSILPNTNPIEQETEVEEGGDEKMRKSSIIPPIMYDRWQRKHQYFNQNDFIQGDVAGFYKEHAKMSYWSPEEKQIFIEKFTQSPKNFGYISSFLENKTTEQCVQFYYMTKKTENYKNLLRKQGQTSKRRGKPNTTTMTTTTVTSSTTIETTLVTKVTSSNTIVSSTSQQILAAGQDAERSIDRIDNDEDRRDINSGDTNEGKSSNKNRCQFLSCTTDKGAKKKNRKNRLRAFPTKWNDLSKDHQEEIRRLLQIPSDVQRCCMRCYEKLILQIRQRQTNEEEDDDNDTIHQNSKHPEEEWNEVEIQAFTEALDKFNHDWTQIAEYVHRSEESCRAFYIKKQRKTISPSDEHNPDEDNGSISGSELGQIKQVHNDNISKTINEDSNDSTHEMVIDENEEQSSTIEEIPFKPLPLKTNLTTITSLVEKEISKTLNETEKRSTTHPNPSPERSIHNTNNPLPPPPLVTVNKSHSQYPSHPQQQYLPKGSIMRGTPISSSIPTNKPIAIDIPSTHSHPHHYNNPRNDYSHLKSPKILDRNIEQQHLLQQQHAAYMRHYTHQQHQQQQYLQQQQQQQQQQHKNSSNKIEPPSTDTFETLRADYVTSKYLTTTATHSPNHERQHRTGPDQRSPPQQSPSLSQPLLPPPTAIAPPTSNPSIQPSPHSHHAQQQQAALLASQLFASTGVYPQDLIASGLLPYAAYYGSLPTNSPFLFDSRLMHEYATAAAAAANNEQLKAEHHKAAMRLSRHHPPPPPSVPGHSPPNSSYSSSKRHSHDLGYPTTDYPTSIWRTQNLSNAQQQMHSQMKLNTGTNENPLLKLNELSRHSATRVNERNSRSPEEYHHRSNQSRSAVESPSMHFQRVEAHNHHKSSHDKSNPNLHFSEHPPDGNPLNYLRQPTNIPKSQTSHHSPHRHHHHPPPPHHNHPHHNPNAPNRTLIPSQISPHHSAYLIHNHHHSPVETISPSRQQPTHYSQHQRLAHHNDSIKNSKESMSIQEFMNKSVNDFVSSTNSDNKTSNTDSSSHEPSQHQSTRIHQVNNSDQPILIDGDEDSNPQEQSDMLNKSNTDSEMPERSRATSIKKILSNQPLEKQEYAEINQKVQNSTVGAAKVHSNNDQTSIERSNSTSGRTKSRGSITMRMLMGASDIYADGKVQSTIGNEEQSNKRSASPNDRCEKLEYLIRDALDRECPPLVKRDETNVFPNQQQPHPSKRLRTSPVDDEQRHSSFSETSESNLPDPFALQPHSKGQHQPLTSPSNPDKNWQAIMQQKQYHLANSYSTPFPSRASRPTGSITQGNPISSSTHLSTDQQPYSSGANNQLINSRYSHYTNKNEQQSSPSISPHDHSPKGKYARRLNQPLSSPTDIQQESSSSASGDHSLSSKSPPANAISTNTSTTPPMIASPTSSSSAHSLKKRLISEYELEQQRNSPVVPTTEETSHTPNAEILENISNTELAEETVSKPLEEPEKST